MKRKIVMTVVTVVVLMLAAVAQADPYFLLSRVFNPDGTSGTAATVNSYAGFSAYRTGLPGEIGKQNSGPDSGFPDKIYPAFYNSVNTPAYAYTDVGSTDWATAPAEAQVIVAVMQVYAGQFGWSGGSYVACTLAAITADNITGSETDFSDLTLRQIPEPAPAGSGADYINIGWTGIDMDLVTGYSVYRSTSLGGTYTAISYTAEQVRNGSVVFTDAAVAAGNTYYYKLAVNFIWGGGGGAPDYFVTDAMSGPSSGIYFGPTPTITPSVDLTVSSVTDTPTVTATVTPTVTVSYTATETGTPTHTVTVTLTYTDTATPSRTVTMSYTVTATVTYTLTQTPSMTPTVTLTCTVSPTSALDVNIASEKVLILNSPIENGRLQIGVYAEGAGTAVIYVYNVAGELVYKEIIDVAAGANPLDLEFKRARGMYLLRVVLKDTAGTRRLPIRKFAVIKNYY